MELSKNGQILSVLSVLLFSLFASVQSTSINGLGVNYGTLGDNLPSPKESVQLIRKLNAGAVKIYDANPTILSALARTGLRVSIMVPNQIIPTIAASQSEANAWVCKNVVPHYRSTKIRVLLVGNEILSDYTINTTTWPVLVPAMKNIHKALGVYKIKGIKVGTPLAMDILSASFPPSSGTFRKDISSSVIRPLLSFLRETKSLFFIDAYSYFPWSQNSQSISLKYALFEGEPSSYYHDPVSKLTYTNLLDQMLDSLIFAMRKLGYNDVKLSIAETGWPNGGNIGANPRNAEIYNRNLVKRMVHQVGTPARPHVCIPTFIFSLYNENLKPGAGTERHWGMYYPDKKPIYPMNLSAKKTLNSVDTVLKDIKTVANIVVPKDMKNEAGPMWCVFAGGEVNVNALQEAVDYGCGQGVGTCNAVQEGGACYQPNSLRGQANWVFNSYWQQFRQIGGTCNFNGLAVLTAKDPSYGSCKFPSSMD